MKLLIALALAAAPSALALAPYVPSEKNGCGEPCEGDVVTLDETSSCAAGAHTWRMINEPTPEHFVASPTAPFPCPLPDAHKSERTKSVMIVDEF